MSATTERLTLKAFVSRHHITASAEWADRNPNAEDGEWAREANHYKVTLRRGRRRMTVYFSMGSALTREPSAEDVLNSLSLDSAGVDNARSFEEWCGEYGYDIDSRKAERTYRVCQRQAEKLQQFLGMELYNVLLWQTEGL